MRIGGAMFFTDYSMSPTELARALEERGFDSLWVPEHSHIPLTRKSPFPSGGDLPKKYYDVMDPFVVLGAAAAVTKTLLLGTGICLIAQRDPIQTAKQVASVDQISGGRFLFGIGNGWNEDEMANHGTAFASRHKLARERIEAMKAIWTAIGDGQLTADEAAALCVVVDRSIKAVELNDIEARVAALKEAQDQQ